MDALKKLARIAAVTVLGVVPLETAKAKPSDMVTSFTAEGLAAVANGLGFQGDILTAENGTKFVGVKLPTGGGFFAMPTACSKGKCVGLELQAVYDGVQVSAAVINEFNQQHVFSQAYLDAGPKLSRYEICDYGIPEGNITANFAVFADLAAKFNSFLGQKARQPSASLTPVTPSAGIAAFGAAEPTRAASTFGHFMVTNDTKKYGYAPAAGSALTPLAPKVVQPFGPPSIR